MEDVKFKIVPLAWVAFFVIIIVLSINSRMAYLPVTFEFSSPPSGHEYIDFKNPGQIVIKHGDFKNNFAAFEFPLRAYSFTLQGFDHDQISGVEIFGHKTAFVNFDKALRAAKIEHQLWTMLKTFLIGLGGAIVAYILILKYHYYEAVNLWNKIRLFTEKLWRHKLFGLVMLIVFSLIIVYLRRPIQFLHPHIIGEEATFVLNDYLVSGWRSMGQTVNGYYVLSTKLISFLAYKISFWNFPIIAAMLTAFLTVAVICAIAFSPTHLKAPYWCAVLTLLVKTGAECFGIALYSFWWAGLLLALVVMWRSKEKPWLRYIFLLFGGFSSPMIIVTAPILIVLAIYKRKHNDIVCALVSLIPLIIQVHAIFQYMQQGLMPIESVNVPLDYIVRSFFGTFVALTEYNPILLLVYGIGLIIILFGAGINWRAKSIKIFIDNNLYYLVLLIWLAGAVASAISRYAALFDLEEMHPIFSVQRYLFNPFVILTWISVWLASSISGTFPKLILKMFMIFVLLNFIVEGVWLGMEGPRMGKFRWHDELVHCLESPEPYALPLNPAHSRDYYMFDSKDAQQLIEASWFDNDVEKNLYDYKLGH